MIEVKGFTGAAIQAAIDAAAPPDPQAAPQTVILPPGTYQVDTPVYIRQCVRVLFDGARLKASGLAAIVVEGNAAQFTSLENVWIYGSNLTYGVVIHASHVDITRPMIDGCFVGLLLESGAGKRLAFPAASDDWYGADHLRIYSAAFWDCGVGIGARGADTNNVVVHGAYGQTVTYLVYSETVGGILVVAGYHENGREADGSDNPRMFLGKDGGSGVLVACGSDGPPVEFDTSPGVVVAPGARVDGPHQSLAGAGLNQLQVTTDAGQAGLLDGAMGLWSRRTGEAQLFGEYDSTAIGDGNWPPGWRCRGPGPSRRPGMALPGEGVVGRRGVWAPEGVILGAAPLQSTVRMTMGTAPPDGPAVEGDWCVNTQPINGVDYWRCVAGGDHPIWVARP